MKAKIVNTRGDYLAAYCGRPGCTARFGQVFADQRGVWIVVLPQPWEPQPDGIARHGKNRRHNWPGTEPDGWRAVRERRDISWWGDLPVIVECPVCTGRQTITQPDG